MTSVAVGARRASGEAGLLAIVAAVAPPLWRDAEATTRGHVAQGSLSGLGVVETTGDAGRLAGKLLVESGASVVRLGPAFGGPAMADPTVAARGGRIDWWFDGGKDIVPDDLSSDAG